MDENLRRTGSLSSGNSLGNVISRDYNNMEEGLGPVEELEPADEVPMDIVDEDSYSGKDNSKIREINVKEVDRGFMVNVGCHTFAISKAEELIELVSEYIRTPHETERKWFNGDLIKR